MQARRARARVPLRGVAAAPERPPAAAVGDPRHLLDVDVDELPGALALVAHGRRRAAAAHLPGHAVDVGEPRRPGPRDDPRACARRHPRGGGERERGEQHGVPRLEDPRLGLGRRPPGERAGPARPVGHRLAPPGAGEPLRGGLAADAHLAGGLGHAGSGPYAGDERFPPPRREPCVRMLGHGMAPSAVSVDNSQHAGVIPICHPLRVNNVMALNT